MKWGSEMIRESFAGLLSPNGDLAPGELQRLAFEQFPTLVESSHMNMWRHGEDLPKSRNVDVLLIGIASYSLYDLELLDALKEQVLEMHNEIYIFDVAAIVDSKDFEEFFPGIGRVFQSPIIGLWKQNELKEKLSGVAARNWLIERYGMSLNK